MFVIDKSDRSSHIANSLSSVYPKGARSVCPDRQRSLMYSHASGVSSPWRNSATRTFRSESRARASIRTYRTDSPGSTGKPRFSICFRAAAVAVRTTYSGRARDTLFVRMNWWTGIARLRPQHVGMHRAVDHFLAIEVRGLHGAAGDVAGLRLDRFTPRDPAEPGIFISSVPKRVRCIDHPLHDKRVWRSRTFEAGNVRA